jgi:hypothetical protein
LNWGEAVAEAREVRKIRVAARKKLVWWREGEILCFPLFLRGVLGNGVRRTWFFCGENVVDCVVNVVEKPSFFDGEKWDTSFEYIFNILFGSSLCWRCSSVL